MRWFALTLSAAALLGGCVTTSYVPTERYVLDPQIAPHEAQPSGLTLGIRPFDAAQPYRQRMAYRTGDARLDYYDHAEWVEPARDSVTRALLDAIEATGRFGDVGLSHDVGAPDLLLIGHIRRFDEVRSESPWVAECEVRIELRRGIKREAVWTATLVGREPIEDGRTSPEGDPSALAQAMSRAVADVAQRAAEEIAALDALTEGPP